MIKDPKGVESCTLRSASHLEASIYSVLSSAPTKRWLVTGPPGNRGFPGQDGLPGPKVLKDLQVTLAVLVIVVSQEQGSGPRGSILEMIHVGISGNRLVGWLISESKVIGGMAVLGHE
eukprot:g41523.t1